MNIFDLFEIAAYGCWSFMTVFFASEIGQRLTDGFADIANKIYKIDWYLLPMEIQRMLPTIMINTQQPTFIECFGSLTCSRDTYKKVSFSQSQSN